MKSANVIAIQHNVFAANAITRVGEVSADSFGRPPKDASSPCMFTFDCGGIEHTVMTGTGLSQPAVRSLQEELIQAMLDQ